MSWVGMCRKSRKGMGREEHNRRYVNCPRAKEWSR